MPASEGIPWWELHAFDCSIRFARTEGFVVAQLPVANSGLRTLAKDPPASEEPKEKERNSCSIDRAWHVVSVSRRTADRKQPVARSDVT